MNGAAAPSWIAGPWVGTVAVGMAVALVVAPLVDRWSRPPRLPAPTDRSTSDAALDDVRSAAPGRRRETTVATSVERLRRRSGRAAIGPAQVAAWLDDVARSARAGAGIAGALVDTPARGALDLRLVPLRRRLSTGDTLNDAIVSWRDRLHADDESLDTAAAVLLVADEVGGSFAVPLERAAALLRGRAADLDERSSWSSQARLSATVMSALPVAVLAFLALVDDSVLETILSPVGGLLIGLGLLLDGVGFLWMRRIVAGAGR